MLPRFLMILAFLTLISSSAFAGFEEGKSAYDRKDWVAAITNLRPLAEAGDDRAMIILGNMYNEGLGVLQNSQEALGLYKRAATEKNNPEGMIAVAAMYTSGIGVNRNINTSLQWFRRAALLGNQMGAFFYATILFRGNKSATDDIKPDFYNSYKWFRIVSQETEYPKFQQMAQAFSKRIAEQKLKPEEVARADKEAADWQPVKVGDIGPPPAEAAPKN